MAVRRANFVDIPRIVAISREAHERSIYANNATFDEIQTKQLCARSIQRHGHTNYCGTLVLVSETSSVVHGFIIGLLDLVYPVLKELVATDLLFIGDDSADPRDAIKMVREVIRWAEGNPKVIEVHLGVTDAVNGDWQRVGALYEHLGLVQCGGMFRMVFDRSEQMERAS
jgi:hypothetical protein